MLAGILIATSATIALFLGLAHIYLTFFTRAFAARDAALAGRMRIFSIGIISLIPTSVDAYAQKANAYFQEMLIL